MSTPSPVTTTTTSTTQIYDVLPLHGTGWIYFLFILSVIMLVLSMVLTVGSVVVSMKVKAAHRITAVLILFCMFSYLGINFTDMIGFYFWSPDFAYSYDDSSNTYMMYTVFWALAKLSLYLVYVYRLYSVYQGTKYSFSLFIYVIVGLLWCIQAGLLIGWLYFYNIIWICCPDAGWEFWAQDGGEAVYATWNNLCWLMLTVDLVLTIFIMSLFLIAMKKVFGALQLIEANTPQLNNVEMENTQTLQSQSGGDAQTNTVDNSAASSDDNQKEDSRLNSILGATTRIMLLCLISLVSSILYQLVFAISLTEKFTGTHAHTALWYLSYTWSIDNFVNIVCLFFTIPVPISKTYYEKWCKTGCKCHNCCHNTVKKLVM